MTIIQRLPLIIIVFINVLFTYKYSLRLTSMAWMLTVIYAVMQFGFGYIRIPIKQSDFIKKVFITGLFVFSISYIYLLSKMDPNSLNVDRWSVITSFWDAFFSNNFPYAAKSHLGNPPGPFPSYFMIALPFYLLGDIGYLSLTGLLLMIYYIMKFESGVNVKVVKILLILSSTCIMWELLVRSTLLINSILILFYLTVFLRDTKMKLATLVWMGILGGILFSTRGIAILPIASACIYKFFQKRDIQSFIIFGSSTIVGFILTLLPFILWDIDLFLKYNPITLQANIFIPFRYLVIFILLSLPIGYYSKTKEELIKWNGINIFFTILTYLVYHLVREGFEEAYVNSIADISYFIFAIPFLLASINYLEKPLMKKPPLTPSKT